MSSRSNRLMIAAVVPFLALWAAAWFDGNVVADAVSQAGRTFDITPETVAFGFAYLIAMGGGLAVAAVAWWVRERIVGLVYVLVGVFILFDGFLVAKFAVQASGAPTAVPEPVARFLTQVMLSTVGRTNSALVVAAAMVLSGIASLILAGRPRPQPAQD
jgi:hypothetical protein